MTQEQGASKRPRKMSRLPKGDICSQSLLTAFQLTLCRLQSRKTSIATPSNHFAICQRRRRQGRLCIYEDSLHVSRQACPEAAGSS